MQEWPHTFLKDVTDFASRSTTTSMGLDLGGSVSTTCTCKYLLYSRLRPGNVGAAPGGHGSI